MAVNQTNASRPLRIRFGLRRVFVLLTILAVLCGWGSHWWRREMAWRRTTAPVREVGGSVAWFSGKTRQAEFAAQIDLNGSEIGDDGLADLKPFTNAKSLLLRNTAITDDGLRHLKPLKQLVWVDLRGTKVTAAGVADLQISLPQAEISH
ncbi:MAG: hypothetical protein QGG36_09180 [Pirellulaceae bacterium]|nr:hypothetical protein [Pirellulaceae bacterium]